MYAKALMTVVVFVLLGGQSAYSQERQKRETLQKWGKWLKQHATTYEGHNGKFAVGDLVFARNASVTQVVDQKNFLFTISYDVRVAEGNRPVTRIRDSDPMWLQNTETKGLTDGIAVNDLLMKYVGTKQYDTVAGSRATIHLWEPYTIEQWIEEQGLDKKSTKTPEKTSDKQVARMWTDTTGKFTVRAVFVGMISGTVSLRKEDGTILKVPLDKLCEEDRKFVKDR